MKSNNKHKNLGDILFIASFIFVLCFASLISIRMIYEVNQRVQDDNMAGSPIGQTTLNTFTENVNNSLDIAILVAMFMAFIVAGITAMLIDINPAFFVVGLIYYILSFILIPIFANSYLTAQGMDNFLEVADKLPIAYLIMSNYVLIWVIMSGIILVALYAKYRN